MSLSHPYSFLYHPYQSLYHTYQYHSTTPPVYLPPLSVSLPIPASLSLSLTSLSTTLYQSPSFPPLYPSLPVCLLLSSHPDSHSLCMFSHSDRFRIFWLLYLPNQFFCKHYYLIVDEISPPPCAGMLFQSMVLLSLVSPPWSGGVKSFFLSLEVMFSTVLFLLWSSPSLLWCSPPSLFSSLLSRGLPGVVLSSLPQVWPRGLEVNRGAHPGCSIIDP